MRLGFTRAKRAIELRPHTARKTARCVVTVVDGYTCSMEEGRWRVVGDLSDKVGGNALGPDPSQLVRMAFGSCAAMAYVQWAVFLDIQISDVEVLVETDHDYRGYYGTADAPAGPTELRYTVSLRSDEPESRIAELLETADRHSPLHDIFERPIKLTRHVKVEPFHSDGS